MRLWQKIVLAILVVEGLGITSGLLTASAIPNWYASLQRPPGNPPNWIFGPVWTVLYGMMGASLALVWHSTTPSAARRIGMTWFGVQLLLNLAWTPAFFGAHQIAVALAIIVALLGSIGVTIVYFRRVHRLAGMLLWPYLAWVSYATYLNAGYLVLNR